MPPRRQKAYRRKAPARKGKMRYRRAARRSGKARYRGKGIRTRYLARKTRLNTNFSRNDFDSVRGYFQNVPFEQASTGDLLKTYFTRLDEYVLAVAKKDDYTEYKITNVQAVLEPLFSSKIFDDHPGNRDAGMQMAVYPRTNIQTPSSTPTWDTVKRTPGVKIISMEKRGRTVLNLKPIVHQIITTEQGVNVVRPMNFGWTDIMDGVSLNVDCCLMAVFVPRANAALTQAPRWHVAYYATIVFRGNKALIDPEL